MTGPACYQKWGKNLLIKCLWLTPDFADVGSTILAGHIAITLENNGTGSRNYLQELNWGADKFSKIAALDLQNPRKQVQAFPKESQGSAEKFEEA